MTFDQSGLPHFWVVFFGPTIGRLATKRSSCLSVKGLKQSTLMFPKYCLSLKFKSPELYQFSWIPKHCRVSRFPHTEHLGWKVAFTKEKGPSMRYLLRRLNELLVQKSFFPSKISLADINERKPVGPRSLDTIESFILMKTPIGVNVPSGRRTNFSENASFQ